MTTLLEKELQMRPRDSSDGEPSSWRLWLEFLVINLFGFALLGFIFLQNLHLYILEGDDTGMSVGIFVVFLLGLVVCALKIRRISKEINRARMDVVPEKAWARKYLDQTRNKSSGSRAIAASLLNSKILNRIVVVKYFASFLVILGLIGTVLGFIIALSGIDPKSMGDLRVFVTMVTDLIRGMGTALYTTLVGGVLNIWLKVNYYPLFAGSARLMRQIVDRGEADANPGSK